MAIAVVIIFILILVVGIATLIYIKKKTNKSIEQLKEDGKLSEDSDLDKASTIASLPFKDIRDSMIDLGNDQYRMVIECSSVNLELKTEEEQEVVEMSFQRFLQSFNYPFAFYVQTREIDNSIIVENTRRDAEQVIKKFPFLVDYANNYLFELQNLNATSGNTKLKKKYIIITYNDIQKMENIEEDEKWDIAFDELEIRCRSAIYGLSGIGITSHILSSNEIAEMVFRAYNKEACSIINGMTSGEMTSVIVDSEKHATQLLPPAKLDLIINEFFHSLETEIIGDKNSPKIFVEAANQTIDVVNKMRDYVGGYYKTYDSSDRNGTYEELMASFGIREHFNKNNKVAQPQSPKQTQNVSFDEDVFEI